MLQLQPFFKRDKAARKGKPVSQKIPERCFTENNETGKREAAIFPGNIQKIFVQHLFSSLSRLLAFCPSSVKLNDKQIVTHTTCINITYIRLTLIRIMSYDALLEKLLFGQYHPILVLYTLDLSLLDKQILAGTLFSSST